MKVRWDLAYDTASFDFYSWLVMAAAKGATEVVFGVDRVRKKAWPEDVIRKRFASICAPGPALLGLPCRYGDDGIKPHGPHMRELVEFYQAGNQFPRLRSILPPRRDVKYTVTLRNNSHIPERNSNVAAWRAFAAEIGALVIEDYDDKPISIFDRMALYAGARMNFGVVNGPMHLVVLSDYPMMMFGCAKAAHAFELCGIPNGASYPWKRANQMTVWDPDDISVIRKHFSAWLAGGGSNP